MKKVVIQFALLAAAFLAMWFLLARIDFVNDLHVRQLTKENERRLGKIVLDNVRRGNRELESERVKSTVDSIRNRLCDSNGIADSSIEVHIIENEEVNAFALPDGNIVVYTGLIKFCKYPEELSGILAHEIGHIEHGDVMKKLMRDIGFSMLMTIVQGNSDEEVGGQMVKLLSSSAYDRQQESAADTAAVNMMAKANIDPKYLADALFRLSQEKGTVPEYLAWFNTHPNSQDRAAQILNLRKRVTFHPEPILDNASWQALKASVDSSKRN